MKRRRHLNLDGRSQATVCQKKRGSSGKIKRESLSALLSPSSPFLRAEEMKEKKSGEKVRFLFSQIKEVMVLYHDVTMGSIDTK